MPLTTVYDICTSKGHMQSIGNSKGFSLIELMISLGISTVLSAGMGYLIVQSFSQNKQVATSMEIDRLNREIKSNIFQSGKSCAQKISFGNNRIPAGTPGPVTIPITIDLQLAGSSERNEIKRGAVVNGFQIAEVEFARAELMGRDLNNNSLYQGFIEIRARFGASGTDEGKRLLQKIIVGSLMAQVNANGNFVDCFSSDFNPDASVCQRLGFDFDAARGTCLWEMNMGTSFGNCDDPTTPMIGIRNGGKRCDRPTTDYCLNETMMTEFKKGRAVCSPPPPDLPQQTPPSGPPPEGAVSPLPPPVPPVTTPVPPPPATPPPDPPGPLPSDVADIDPPPACSKLEANNNCQQFCFDFLLGANCANLCAASVGADEPCAVVVSNPTPPPLPPPTAPPVVNPPPTTPPPPPASCSCGGTIVASGRYCGYCYRNFEAEPMFGITPGGTRRFPVNVREEAYLCQNGALVFTSTTNPNRGICRGDWETW